MKIHPDDLLTWRTSRFYDMVLMLAWEAHYQSEYQKLIAAKK
jgi:hypothetical protein